MVEAYGRKGFKNTAWRKTFKTTAALNKWVETHDATVDGIAFDDNHADPDDNDTELPQAARK